MDAHIEDIKRRGYLGADLTEDDWRLLLSDAEEVGSLQGVFTALTKLNTHPITDTLESLLCTAICVGDVETALDTCKHLGRELLPNEKLVLIESVMLSGNAKGFIECIEFQGCEMRALLHTTIVIGVCRFLYKKRTGSLPRITLTTWLRVCHREFGSFSPRSHFVLSEFYPGAILLRLERSTLGHFAGALLMESFISRGNFRLIIK